MYDIDYLNREREKQCLTYKELAVLSGVSYQRVHWLFLAKATKVKRRPSPDVVGKVAKALHVSMERVVVDEKEGG